MKRKTLDSQIGSGGTGDDNRRRLVNADYVNTQIHELVGLRLVSILHRRILKGLDVVLTPPCAGSRSGSGQDFVGIKVMQRNNLTVWVAW